MRRPRAAPVDHRLDVLIISFKHCFNPAVIEIFYPSGKAALFRFITRVRTEEDTLHPSADKEVDSGF
jgi:hypothetical protein